jgi:hypothetical protein
LGVGTNAPSRTLTIEGSGARIRDLNIGVTSATSIGNTNNIIMNVGTLGFGFRSGGALTAAAMLHVMGDGTNNILRLDNGAGTQVASISNSGNITVAALTTSGDLTLKRSDNSEVISFFNSPNALDFGSSLVRVRFQSQTVAINSLPDASAALTIASTTRGFLPPRMTTTQVNAIASPAEGLVVYSTTANALCLYNGSSWRKLNDSPL